MISAVKPKSKIDRRALTFLELILAIAVIGALAAISVPQFRKVFDKFELENFAKDIYYLSRYLQGSAISQGKIYCLNIDEAAGKFWATSQSEDEFKNIEGRFGKVYQTQQRIIISINATEETDKTGIYFYPDGSIDKAKINFEDNYKNKVSLVLQGAAGGIKIQ